MKPNEVKFPSEIPIITSASDDDTLLAARSDRSYGSITLSRIFSWLKPKFTAPLAIGKSIATILATDNNGNFAVATPAQVAAALATPLAPVIAPMLGIDHSILTEQLIPGEFWLDSSGARKQVYVRTFVGTTPTAFEHTGNTHLYHWVWSISAGVQLAFVNVYCGYVGAVDDAKVDYETGQIGYIVFAWGNQVGVVVNNNCKSQYLNKPYNLTIKYTKQ